MRTSLRSILSATALFAASGFIVFGAQTASAQAPGSDARMQKERATCDGVQQDRAACLREAGAARQEAGRGGLTSPSPAREQVNALARCGELPAAEQPDCEARIKGGSRTTTEGSVMGGGVIRETVTPLPPQTVPAPAR
ncbi:hypothetical protein ABL840_07190 [Variovorax sp. NFACC27]|jgi:hypothetical protein|uniref:hypothetical protein n=1 Tax=unclassified Variovorax TaxID=663243 RepID=UPI00089480A2|nr:hypothetical protein [Variovorax sp. YR750]MDP9602771.1 hypothetical protein [Variovorax paradoxus]SEF20744.1 hypothetical protein SAMN03159371_00565 [Variovorax sp. NFACC28]SEF54074.1 hypothetical protein SAMN03159365_00253 [Variovorax sp. NFACC29]SFB69555.1 hypothetical protein SAMN03159379_00252 [Variovorax sp. NFACC26]SFG51498.1 hypothetical protein SAMN03159447_03653 [Variovorax sp. NFACC27]